MSDDKRPKRAASPVPPRQRRSKKRKIDVNLEQQTVSEVLPTSASSVTTSGEAMYTYLEQCVDDTVTSVDSTESPLILHSGVSAVSTQGLSVADSTLLSQSEYPLPTSASHTESGHHTASNRTCKYIKGAMIVRASRQLVMVDASGIKGGSDKYCS
jgi:hypothetical protein